MVSVLSLVLEVWEFLNVCHDDWIPKMDAGTPKDEPQQLASASRPIVHILLVDDNAGDAKLISSFFRDFDAKDFSLEVQVAPDGENALDHLLQRGHYADQPLPDAIILDINLPKKNGFEVLADIRSHHHLRRIPVFVLTTSRSDEDIMKSYSLDALAFYTKPSQLVDFEDVMRRLLTMELPRVLRDAGKTIRGYTPQNLRH